MHPRQQNRRRFSPRESRLMINEILADGRSTAERMADIFIERAKDGQEDTCHNDLVREGFSEADVIKHYDEANALAGEELRDVDVNEDRTTYDRSGRVTLGANAVAGLLLSDTGAVHTACRLAGLQTPEIGKLFDDIIGEAMRIVRETRMGTAVQ